MAKPQPPKKKKKAKQVFLSFSGRNSFEASLLVFAAERLLKPQNVKVWSYQKDQEKDQQNVAKGLKESVKNSAATVFLVSPQTLDQGAAQWMELAYADAFKVPTFVMLHQLTFAELKAREHGVPPLLLGAHCNDATQWRDVLKNLQHRLNVKARVKQTGNVK